MSLNYLLDNPQDLTLVGDTGEIGILRANVAPTDETGIKNISEEIDEGADCIDDP
jgi:hypothetical protein